MDLLRKRKNYPKIAGQLVENGRGDFFLLRLKFLARRFFKMMLHETICNDDFSRISASQHCFECLLHCSNIAKLCCIPCAFCYEPYLSKVVAMPTGLQCPVLSLSTQTVESRSFKHDFIVFFIWNT